MKSRKELVFRESNDEEATKVEKVFNYFIEDNNLNPLNDMRLWSREGNIIELFGVTNKTDEILKSIKKPIFSSGIPLGTIKQNKFQLEIEGAMLILPLTQKVIEVKTDQFLYGKSIYCENISRIKSEFTKNQLVIVIGRNNLHYGLGETLISSEELKNCTPNTVVIKGYRQLPKDRGWYLREGN